MDFLKINGNIMQNATQLPLSSDSSTSATVPTVSVGLGKKRLLTNLTNQTEHFSEVQNL